MEALNSDIDLRFKHPYHMVHSLRDGHSEVWICEFWVKENFWAQKPFVTDVYIEKFFRYAVHTTVLFDVFLRICVEFIKLFGYVRTYIAVPKKVNKTITI